MMLTVFEIENFRGIRNLRLELDRTTVLIGENNTGKTAVLEALSICLSRGLSRRSAPFTEYDFHLTSSDADPTGAPPIVLTLTFEETAEDEWPLQIEQVLESIIQIPDDGRKRVIFRVTGMYDEVTREPAVEWCFLDLAGNPLTTARQGHVTELQSFVPVFFLTALRDASEHFHSRSMFWGSFIRNPQFDDAQSRAIEEQLAQINQAVLDSHKPFEVVKDRLAQTGKFLPLGSEDLVSVEAVPARWFDVLARTQVKLAARTGARLPITRHGAGTQSLSVLFLFEAFLQSRLEERYREHASPVLAIEEPETHLHPSAVSALWPVLDEFAGQKIIATHSGDLLSTVPLTAVRRLARKNGEICVYRVKEGTLKPREAEKVAFHVRSKRGSILFARCWLFVEGESEFSIIPELAHLLGYDLYREGVACVDFVHCGIEPLIKVADDLGIEWHLLTDNDKNGESYADTAKSHLAGRPFEEHVTILPQPGVEYHFWEEGYASVIEKIARPKFKRSVRAEKGTALYVKETVDAAIASMGGKPPLALALLEAVRERGRCGVPNGLRTAIEASVRLARTCA